MKTRNTLIAISFLCIAAFLIRDLIKNPFFKEMMSFTTGDGGYSILRRVSIIFVFLTMGLLILYHEYFGEGFVW